MQIIDALPERLFTASFDGDGATEFYSPQSFPLIANQLLLRTLLAESHGVPHTKINLQELDPRTKKSLAAITSLTPDNISLLKDGVLIGQPAQAWLCIIQELVDYDKLGITDHILKAAIHNINPY